MFFGSPAKGKVVLAISIQSGVVRGTLIYNETGQIPFVFFHLNRSIHRQDYTDDNYHTKVTLKTVKELIAACEYEFHKPEYRATLPKKISEVHYVLSSPWIVSHGKRLSKTFAHPTIVTKKGIVQMILNERAQYLSSQNSTLQIIEEKIFDVKLNGYSVESWEGRLADGLEISFAISLVDQSTIQALCDITNHALHKRPIYFHSALLLHHVGLQEVEPNKKNYTHIHIHSDLTDVVIVENKMCVFFGSFNNGVRTIVSTIAAKLDITEQAAESMLSLYIGSKLEDREKDRAKDVIEKLSENWINEFEKILKESDYKGVLPENVIITSHYHEQFFGNSYKNKHSDAKIETMEFDSLSKMVKFAPQADRLRVIALYAIALNVIA